MALFVELQDRRDAGRAEGRVTRFTLEDRGVTAPREGYPSQGAIGAQKSTLEP